MLYLRFVGWNVLGGCYVYCFLLCFEVWINVLMCLFRFGVCWFVLGVCLICFILLSRALLMTWLIVLFGYYFWFSCGFAFEFVNCLCMRWWFVCCISVCLFLFCSLCLIWLVTWMFVLLIVCWLGVWLILDFGFCVELLFICWFLLLVGFGFVWC